MGIERLSPSDVEVVRECLDAAVRGPFFPDSEFHTLIGLTSDEVDAVLASPGDPRRESREREGWRGSRRLSVPKSHA